MLIVVELSSETMIRSGEWLETLLGPEERREYETLTFTLANMSSAGTVMYVVEYGKHISFGASTHLIWVVEADIPSTIRTRLTQAVQAKFSTTRHQENLDADESHRTIAIRAYDSKLTVPLLAERTLREVLRALPLPCEVPWYPSSPTVPILSRVHLPTRTCSGGSRHFNEMLGESRRLSLVNKPDYLI